MTYVFIETSGYIGGAFWIFFNNKVFVGAVFLAGQHAIFFWVECIFLTKKSQILIQILAGDFFLVVLVFPPLENVSLIQNLF